MGTSWAVADSTAYQVSADSIIGDEPDDQITLPVYECVNLKVGVYFVAYLNLAERDNDLCYRVSLRSPPMVDP